MTLTTRTISGVIWNFGSDLARRGIGLLFTLVLAHFLHPADYGLLSMMALFLALGGSLMDSGFSEALIRQKDVTDEDLTTAFYANVALGLVSYLALFAGAPAVAAFYEEPRLTTLIRVASLAVVINALQVVPMALLSRALNFKLHFTIQLPAAAVSGTIAIVLSWAGYGIWALIAQLVAIPVVTTTLLWYLQPWRPSARFDRDSLRRLYRFGYKLFLSGALDTTFKNLYVAVVAKLFAHSIAGHFFFARQAGDLIVQQLVSSIQTVTYPALASVQDDPVRLRTGYRRVVEMTTFLLFPALLFIAALATLLFDVFLPPQWHPAALYFQLVCLAALLNPLHSINLNILKVMGRSDLFLLLEVLKKCLAAAILLVSYRYGVLGILYGQILGSLVAYLLNSYHSARLIRYSVIEQLWDFVPGLALAGAIAAAMLATHSAMSWPPLVEIIVLGILGSISYLAGSYLLQLNAFCSLEQLLRERWGRS